MANNMNENSDRKRREFAKQEIMLLYSKMFKDYKEKFESKKALHDSLIIGILTGITINIFTSSLLEILTIGVWVIALISGIVLAYLLYRLLIIHFGFKAMADFMQEISHPKKLELLAERMLERQEKLKEKKDANEGKK